MILGESQDVEDDLGRPKPVILLLLDGFGIAPANDGNAITSAKTPYLSKLIKKYPIALLSSSGSLNSRYLSLGCGINSLDENIKTESCLASVLSAAGLRQLKICDSLRLAALNNFFNGGREESFSGEACRVISSVSRGRELKKSSLSKKVFDELLLEMNKSDRADFIIVSVSSLDVSARSGDFEATKKMISELDSAIKKISEKALEKDFRLIISAAFGNAEKMLDFTTDTLDKNPTNNPVPFIIVGSEYEGKTIGLSDPLDGDLSLLSPEGSLADLAPSVIAMFSLAKPESMTGKSLI